MSENISTKTIKIKYAQDAQSKLSTEYAVETIKIKYHADIEPLVQKKGSDWIDLRVAEEVRLRPETPRRI